MQTTAQGWLVLRLTDSPALLGVATAASSLPVLLLSVYAGVLADRFDRRWLLGSSQVVQGLAAASLAILTMAGIVQFWQIALLAAVAGTAQALGSPAFQALVPALAGTGAIGNAVALNSAQFNLSRVVGPAIAGVVVGLAGEAPAFWLNALSFGAVVWVLLRIRLPPEEALERTEMSMWAHLLDGLAYVRERRVLVVLLALAGAPAVFLLPYLTLLPVFARDILGIGAEGLGLLTAAIGIGALSGALGVAFFRPAGGSGRTMLAGLFVMVVGVAAFAESTSVAVSCAALAVVGAAQVAYFTSANTLIQLLSPPRLRGRIISLYVLTSFGLAPLGSLVAGALAQTVGAPLTLVMGAAAALVGTLAALAAFPGLGTLRTETIARYMSAGAR